MNLSGLVAVSGKAGLYKIIGQSKAGFILQSLEEPTGRVVVNANARLAALDETTVYGIDQDLALREILVEMQRREPEINVPDPRADSQQLRAYFLELVPEHDQQRVYTSDIKKILSWYKLLETLPLFREDDPKQAAPSTPSVDSSDSAELQAPTITGELAETSLSPETKTKLEASAPKKVNKKTANDQKSSL